MMSEICLELIIRKNIFYTYTSLCYFVDPARKINFNLKLTLVCDASWVQFPTHLDLMHMPRAFAIRVEASNLPEGVHTTR